MFSFFLEGGPMMWPIFLTSLVAVTVVIERFLFLFRQRRFRREDLVEKILSEVERGNVDEAIRSGEECKDPVVATLVYGLRHHNKALSNALLQAANKELKRFSWGLPILDTIITLAPLLGLLGTVTGMIHAFGLLGNKQLEAPTVITGGIAQALIATACGLGVAIIALIPFNYLNARLEEVRHDIEDAITNVEILLKPDTKI